jgi:hypothetical protein
METSNKKVLTLEEVNEILSDALLRVSERKLPLKQANLISRLALSLSKNIVNTELKNRVEFLEQRLKNTR